ncbi:TPA: hypothetical protein MEH29_001735 [Klebsiella pneumoniae]|nr:hypothetical protein [Klebsiella pneumoniae]
MKYFACYRILEREGVQSGVGSTVFDYTDEVEPEIVFAAIPKAIAEKRKCEPDDVVITAFNRV